MQGKEEKKIEDTVIYKPVNDKKTKKEKKPKTKKKHKTLKRVLLIMLIMFVLLAVIRRWNIRSNPIQMLLW